MPEHPQRLSSAYRGWFIAGILAIYGWIVQQPAASLTGLLLFGAALQAGVILIRRFVPPESQGEVFYVYEYLADGASVLLFAIGVFSGIAAMNPEI